MRIAFYAPIKPLTHPEPSGDRTMGRLLMSALTRAGNVVQPVSRFRSYDGAGDALRQRRIADLGCKLAHRLTRRCAARPADTRPDLWFTYHLYHKAPDWLGPQVSAALGIPYVVAEASHAAKQVRGPWALGCAAAARAIRRAELIFDLNSADSEGVRPLLADRARLAALPPFIDTSYYALEDRARADCRRAFRTKHGIWSEEVLLLTAAMMRPGDKLASYSLLGEALALLQDQPWRLLVAGDGPARAEVRQALAAAGGRVIWLGRLSEAEMPAVYASADLFVWPAIREAWGMTLLEAQASGLPVVAGRSGGIADIVEHGHSGILVRAHDAREFALAVASLLDDDSRRRMMGRAAQARARFCHDIETASETMNAALHELVATRSYA